MWVRYTISYWVCEGRGGWSPICSASRELREISNMATSMIGCGDGDRGGKSGVEIICSWIAEKV